MMPLVWLREYTGEKGKTSKILTTTMGAATDLACEDLRRFAGQRLLLGRGFGEADSRAGRRSNHRRIQADQLRLWQFKPGVKPDDLKLP